MYEWPPLIAELIKARSANTPTDDPHVQQLVQRWMSMFRAYAGDEPDTHARIREAYAKEPDLRNGSAVSDELLGYVRAAMATERS